MTEPQFSKLELTILKSKGVSAEALTVITEAGVYKKEDFATVGNAQTLVDITGIELEVAQRVMDWAVGSSAGSTQASMAEAGQALQNVVIDSADVVYCSHCKTKQPKDYKSGDLCSECGKQAEPSLACHWCNSSGPGKFCRSCGSQLLPTSELELGLLLKREGVPKDDIATKVMAMDQADKDVLWARIRASRY